MAKHESAPAEVLQTVTAVFLARALYNVVSLGIPDMLGERGSQTCRELADQTEVKPNLLRQELRSLTMLGLFRTDPGRDGENEHRFSLTELGDTLRKGHPSRTREMVMTLQGPTVWESLSVLPERIRTGRTGPEIAFGKNFFDVIKENSEQSIQYNETMRAVHGDEPVAVSKTYDLSDFARIVDVGGGIGTLLGELVVANPGIEGILYEQPHVLGEAQDNLTKIGAIGRCKLVGGDFFESVPTGGDVYILSHIVHDWDDHHCVRILRNCREAMNGEGRIVIVEMVLPSNDDPHPGKIVDLIMLSLTSGTERTSEEYQTLLEDAGFRMTRILSTESAVSIVEGVPA